MLKPHLMSSASSRLPAAVLLGACLASASCATLAHGRMQHVTVTSDPTGAYVYLGPTLLGRTPARVVLPRRSSHPLLRLEKEGFEPAEVQLRRVYSPWLAGDVAYSTTQLASPYVDSLSRRTRAAATVAAMTAGVDFATGSAFRLTPATVHVTLRASGADPSPATVNLLDGTSVQQPESR